MMARTEKVLMRLITIKEFVLFTFKQIQLQMKKYKYRKYRKV